MRVYKAVVTYLGNKVGQGQVKPVEVKVEVILRFHIPCNKRELRRFLGMVGYYRSFCQFFYQSNPFNRLAQHCRKSLYGPLNVTLPLKLPKTFKVVHLYFLLLGLTFHSNCK